MEREGQDGALARPKLAWMFIATGFATKANSGARDTEVYTWTTLYSISQRNIRITTALM